MNSLLCALRLAFRALGLSASAVSLLVVALGIGIVPFQADSIWNGASLTINKCYEGPDGKLLSLIWTSDAVHGRRDYVVRHSLRDSCVRLEVPWPKLVPRTLTSAADQLFIATNDGGIYRVPSRCGTSGPELIGQLGDKPLCQLMCSADGRWLLIVHPVGCQIWDLYEKTARAALGRRSIRCIAAGPDQARALCGMDNGDVLELDLASGKAERTLARHGYEVVAVAVSPAGNQVASLCWRGQLQVTDLLKGDTLWTRHLERPLPALIYSPDGEKLVWATSTGAKSDIAITDASTGRTVQRLPTGQSLVRGLAFLQSGELCSWGGDGVYRLWQFGPAWGKAAGRRMAGGQKHTSVRLRPGHLPELGEADR